MDLSGKTLTLANDQISGDVIHGGTISNFASTGIDDNATSTAITIDSSERVGIGTTSPARLLTLSGSGATLLSLVSTNDDNCQVLFGDSASDTVGKVVYAHDTNHMRFETNGAERMRIDAGGSVLIGKTTPTDLHNTWNHLIIGEKGAIISQNGAGGIGGITISDNAYIDADTGSYAYQTTAAASKITQSGGVTTFSNAASGTAGTALTLTERMRIDSAGKVGVGITNPSGSFQVTTKDASGSDVFVVAQNTTSNRLAGYRVLDESGAASLQMQYDNGGNAASISNPNNGALSIYLGGTAAANALDDYEEGSWTPQVFYQNSTDQANATNTVQSGRYRKIGSLVYVTFRLDFSQGGSPVNDNIGVKNLPFAGSLNHYEGGGNVITSSSEVGLIFSLPNASSTVAVLVNSANVGNFGNEFGSGSNKYIRGSFTYITS